ncbi:hypothetical protein [Paenibacillus beijingensis]|uniref:FAD-dependent oxidoreductase 2 FAD binding domain-containing protein n=1 Tax=Paenibacillus beijingensis TaxID=1126833 RepID=A0A0D5NK40_9BACL|nr:hypothetical protein [Paenibacillus beijingensis]AJY75606.1 hypothetical protein VN24_14875 [Paenibacillus beijingensis]
MDREIKSHYSTVIFGATFSGIGAALAAPGDTLVLERSGSVGQEFIESFNPGRYGAPLSLSAFGQAFVEELLMRNVIATPEEPVHLPALHPILCRKVLDANAQVIFLAETLLVQPLENRFEVVFFSASGMRTITAGRILDTTTRSYPVPATVSCRNGGG